VNNSLFGRARALCLVAGLGAGSAALALAATAANASVPPYTLVGSFAVTGDAFDILPDGRVVTISGHVLSMQSAIGASSYAAIGSVPTGSISGFGASFLSVSPSGTSIAIGDNNFGPGASVVIVATASLNPGASSSVLSIATPNSEAAWNGEGQLFVSGFGSGPVVTRIDIGALTATTVITAIGDGSGGIAVRAGRLYAGIGFDATSGGALTGDIRAFDLAGPGGIATGAASVGFGTGVLVADALSAGSLGFDAAGSLLVGGGDFFSGSNDFGYAAAIDGDAILAALAGGSLAGDSAELRLSPAGASAFYSVRFNSALNEVLVVSGGVGYRYAVPTPAAAGLLALSGLVAARRQRAGTAAARASARSVAHA